MTLLKKRVAETDEKLRQIKEANKVAAKERRTTIKQSRADRERKALLAGQAVLRRVERGEMDEAEFRQMMGEFLSRAADRALFELD